MMAAVFSMQGIGENIPVAALITSINVAILQC